MAVALVVLTSHTANQRLAHLILVQVAAVVATMGQTMQMVVLAAQV